jgi:hypothetical protein
LRIQRKARPFRAIAPSPKARSAAKASRPPASPIRRSTSFAKSRCCQSSPQHHTFLDCGRGPPFGRQIEKVTFDLACFLKPH